MVRRFSAVVIYKYLHFFYALGINIAYPLEDWAQFSSFPRWWEVIYPLLGVPAILGLICLPAILARFPRLKQEVV